jgi:hypothetical protein
VSEAIVIVLFCELAILFNVYKLFVVVVVIVVAHYFVYVLHLQLVIWMLMQHTKIKK